jgi:predicted acylesterase/phospholipase RssA
MARMAQLEQDIHRAKLFLAGESMSPEDVLRLAKRLKGMAGQNGFRWARRILARARKDQAALAADPELARALGQEQSLCTYKDPDLPALRRLHDALCILQTVDHPDRSSDDETLGQAGAIYKQLWADTGQKLHLERSYAYYRKAYDFDPVGRNPGYCGINAAFVLDLLADLETRDAALAGTEGEMAARRRAEAAAIRGRLIELLTPLEHEPDKSRLRTDWWYLVTRAEAHFGLDEHTEAGALLQRAKHDCQIEPWQFFSTARQLATLHQLRSSAAAVTGNGPVAILAAFLASDSGSEPGSAAQTDRGMLQTKAALESAFKGQVGLALSGGGFRASIFHLGVLAKLAELDLLRRIEVLSCVSGGSIVGAQYYLQLREELQRVDTEKLLPDELRELYVRVVKKVIDDFLHGVRRNIRNRVFANPVKNLRAMLPGSYNRTVRLGELFERELFSRTMDDGARQSARRDGIHLTELKIQPVGEAMGFNPKTDNWRRRAKVPILVLNATTLNTGHNWQYTATWMGESPHAIDAEVDGNNRLRRMWYDSDAPPRWKRLRLGHAVVASACVPGLFEPIRLDHAYGRFEGDSTDTAWTVRHVDGGVHDNQGITSLLEQGCSVLLVSDASGQSTTLRDPGGSIAAPLMRCNAILMQRIREEQFRRLRALEEGGLLKGLMIVHLKMGLDVKPVGWLGCEDPPEQNDSSGQAFTDYGMRKTVQERLAALRTDLDCFSEAEAFALMTSGYRMVEKRIGRVGILDVSEEQAQAERGDWPFLQIDHFMNEVQQSDPTHRELMRLLSVGRERLFKVWRLLPGLGYATGITGLILLILLGWLLWQFRSTSLNISGWSLIASVLILIGFLIVLAVPVAREQASRIGLGGGLVAGGWLAAVLNLWVTSPMYLWLGSLQRLKRIERRYS